MITLSDIYAIQANKEKPGKGKVLVASPFITEKCFKRSVVYLFEEGEDDTYIGLVLNKKSGCFLGDIIREIKWLPKIPVYLGGPVGTNRLLYLHCMGNIFTDSVHIKENIYLGTDLLSVISYISAGNKIDGYVKFFLGYSGWGAGQLKMEIATEGWGVANLQNSDSCLKYDNSLWRKSVITLGEGYSSWLRIPGSYNYN